MKANVNDTETGSTTEVQATTPTTPDESGYWLALSRKHKSKLFSSDPPYLP